MIQFLRYPHVHELFSHYIHVLDRSDIKGLLENDLHDESDAKLFSKFVWEMVCQMHEDEENGVEVLGSIDNSDMMPDISYEVTKLMREKGFYEIWNAISEEEI